MARKARKQGYENGYEEMINDEWDNYTDEYNKEYRNQHARWGRNQDQYMAQGLMSQAMSPMGKRGGRIHILKKTKANKAQSDGISKVTVDNKGPVKSIKKKTIVKPTGKGKKDIKKKLGKFKTPGKPGKTLKMKNGGVIAEPDSVNVVVKGKLHKENNNLGNKDKGVPVITPDGEKTYEVEKQEIILRKSLTDAIEEARESYKSSKDNQILDSLGKLVAQELLTNTQDNDGKFGVRAD
jgi:hypothetical protein